LSKIIFKSGSEGDFETSLAASKEKLQLCITHPRLMGNLSLKYGTLYDAYSAAVMLKGKKRVKEATAFVKEFNEITVQLEFPDSEQSLENKRLLNTPPLKETVKKFFRGKNYHMV
jgi:hypothetical protein